MFAIPEKHPHANAAPSIFLEYGADGEQCNDKEIRICHRGMSFKSRWQFEMGAELAISLTYRNLEMQLQRADLQGTIAGCEKVCRCCYQITLLFVEVPLDLQPVILEIADRLKANAEMSPTPESRAE